MRAIDKRFSVQSEEAADKKLTSQEVANIAAEAEAEVKAMFPKHPGSFHVTPVIDPVNEFAGYRLVYSSENISYDETFEFDFGSQGIDVIK